MGPWGWFDPDAGSGPCTWPLAFRKRSGCDIPTIWTPTLEGWPAATIEVATRSNRTQRQGATNYQFNFHKVSQYQGVTVSRGGVSAMDHLEEVVPVSDAGLLLAPEPQAPVAASRRGA